MTRIDYRTQTTIVTGASAGIGLAYARALAARGSDLVLVARRLDRLESLAASLREQHGVSVTPIQLDLRTPDAGRRLRAELDDREIQVTGLVNNAAFGTDGPFHEEDADTLQGEIAVDVASVVDLSRAFIEPLREAGVGILVNVASMAAYNPGPQMAVYSACKAFVLSFTEALWHEARGTGLRVLCVSPGLTSTEFFDALGSEAYRGNYETPEQVVQTAIRTLDAGNRQPSVVSGRMNRVVVGLGRLLSRRRGLLIAGAMTARARSGNDQSGGPRIDGPTIDPGAVVICSSAAVSPAPGDADRPRCPPAN